MLDFFRSRDNFIEAILLQATAALFAKVDTFHLISDVTDTME